MYLRKGARGPRVKLLQRALTAAGFDPGAADGIFGRGTQSAVEKLQDQAGLLEDAVFGPDTRAALHRLVPHLPQASLREDCGEHAVAELVSLPRKQRMRWLQTVADRWHDGQKLRGLTVVRLREDVMESYYGIKREMESVLALLTTAGGKRGLKLVTGDPEKDVIGKAQSKTSLHYLGLAFDLATNTGGTRLDQPFILTRDPNNSRAWIVWAKADSEEVPEVILDAVIISGWKKTKMKTAPIRGRYINFTVLAAKYGFHPISGRRSFWRGGHYLGAEWWHFQHEASLVPNKSVFGQELLKLYPLGTCKRFLFWDLTKDAVWQRDFF